MRTRQGQCTRARGTWHTRRKSTRRGSTCVNRTRRSSCSAWAWHALPNRNINHSRRHHHRRRPRPRPSRVFRRRKSAGSRRWPRATHGMARSVLRCSSHSFPALRQHKSRAESPSRSRPMAGGARSRRQQTVVYPRTRAARRRCPRRDVRRHPSQPCLFWMPQVRKVLPVSSKASVWAYARARTFTCTHAHAHCSSDGPQRSSSRPKSNWRWRPSARDQRCGSSEDGN